MADKYNPNAPRITGLEWVPVREFGFEMSRFDSPTEIGTTFTLNRFVPANKAFWYIKEFPEDFVVDQPYTVNIYPRGLEAASGPIERILVPVSSNSTFVNNSSTQFTLVNANNLPQALQDPSSDSFVRIETGNQADFDMFLRFSTDQAWVQDILTNKRILGINFLYAGAYIPDNLGNDQLLPGFKWNMRSGSGGDQFQYPLFQPGLYQNNVLNRVSIGDVNPWFGTNTSLDNLLIIPWTRTELSRWNDTSANGINIRLQESFTTSVSQFISDLEIYYVALEILFCEERRVAFGTRMIGPLFANHYIIPPATGGPDFHAYWWNFNANFVNLFNPSTLAANPILPPGEYTMSVVQSSIGQPLIQSRFPIPVPQIQTSRQLYEIPNLRGMRIDHPVPMDDTAVGKTLTKTTIDTLPQLALFASGSTAPVLATEVHAYGRITVGQVYTATGIGTPTITQQLTNNNSGFWYARWYCRRFGNTVSPLVLSPTGPMSGANATALFITPDEWDALPTIVDGWKEVTLQWPTPMAMSGGVTQATFTWSSSADRGDRWEVLGASALALSGTPLDNLNLYPSWGRTNGATYGGTTASETWMPGFPKPSSSVQNDPSSDAILILADMLAAPTLSLSQPSQALSGIGEICNVTVPPGVPSAIAYNQLSWGVSNGYFADNFNRIAANGLGGSWSVINGTASNFSADGTKALIKNNAGANQIAAVTTISYTDIDAKVVVSAEDLTGGVYAQYMGFRTTDAQNLYKAVATWTSNNTGSLSLEKRVASVTTVLATVPLERTVVGQDYFLRVVAFSQTIKIKIWRIQDPEPAEWQINVNDTTFSSGFGCLGTSSGLGTGSIGSFDDYVMLPFNMVGSTLQIERSDTIDTTWRVIMKTADLSNLFFNDYEARVGVLTSYRMRLVDQYGFNGAYSSTVTATIAAPGVSGFQVGESNQHILIFTTNERQDGRSNLAYSSAWQGGQVSEDFTFPESSFVQLQPMYLKDFYTAFRPTERGGDNFQRELLVQAAAISPPTLDGFTSLRNMAWDTVSYICVRDEQGNRWFATVNVPTGSVVHNRSLYIANVSIQEVTNIPSQVDP